MIDKHYLNKLRKEIEKLVANSDSHLSVGDIKTGSFNIKRNRKLIHIGDWKFKTKGNQLLFDSRINYNIRGRAARIENSPGVGKNLMAQLEQIYPNIKELINKEKFLQTSEWVDNYLPLTGKIQEDARRLTIYAALKLYYTPKYNNQSAKFESDKFEELYNKKLKQATSGDKYKTTIDEETNTLNHILNAINTKPFVILSGISGTGKTQIGRIISAGLVEGGSNGKK
ncbi:MAG: hypothetical protein ABIK33_03980 [candidate division WOR-3 bacterium]